MTSHSTQAPKAADRGVPVRHTGPPCLVSDDDEHVPVRCTRARGHDGDHEADDGEVIVARWAAKEVQSSHTPAAKPTRSPSLRERFEQAGITPEMARWVLDVYIEHGIDDPVAVGRLRAYLERTAA